jgi:acetolactate synthase I/II/III large subunit
MDLQINRHSHVDFTNPDFVAYAKSFGAYGHQITATDQLLPTLK